MHLNSIINYCFFIAISFQLVAQQDDSLNNEHELLGVKLGGVLPMGFGDNFASEAIDFSYGAELQANFYIFESAFFFGYRFQYLRGDVEKQSLVGNYDYTNVTFNGLNLGYQYKFSKKWGIEPSLSYGRTRFRNYQTNSPNSLDFEDSANTLFVSLPFNYSLSKVFKIYLQPEYRTDFMNIKTAASNASFFDRTQFFNLVVGVKLLLF